MASTQVINTFMSMTSVCVYVYDTYIPIDEVSRDVYLACSCTFSVEYVAKLLATDDRISYVLWDWSLIDLATIGYGCAYYAIANVSNDFGFIRLLRIIQVRRPLQYYNHNIYRQM